MKTKNKGILTALFSTLFFSSYSIFGKLLLENLTPETLLAISQTVSVTILIFFFGLLPELKVIRKLSREKLLWVLVIAMLSGVLAPLLALMGLQKTSALNTIMLGRFEVVAGGIIAVLWLKEKVSYSQITGMGLMLLGITFIVTQGFAAQLAFSGGDSFVIAAALIWALANVLFKRYLHHLKPEVMVLVRNALGAVTLLFLIPLFFPIQHDFSALEDGKILTTVVIFSIFSIILAQFLWYRSLHLISTTLVSGISLLTPFFGIILAVLILKEQLSWYHLLGGVFVISGLIFNVIHRQRHPQEHHGFWYRLLHVFH